MPTAIRVENLTKCYRIDHLAAAHDNYRTLRESLVSFAKSSFRRLRRANSSTSHEDFWALNDVSFEVQRGEVIGIIGRNGAGKSTLLKILSRIAKPTSGRVTLHGRVGSLLEVGTGFHPELTGRENVYLNGSILGMRRSEIGRQFDAIVDFAGVEKFLDTPVKRYSSGMYVRLAFAVAAHLNPEILIVDEVLAVGDMEFQRKCLGKMGEVAQHGRTVLLVSHQMPVVEKLCTAALMLRDGRIETAGKTEDVIKSYLAGFQESARTSYKAEAEGDGPAYLIGAEVLNSIGAACEVLRFGEPFSIRLHWKHKTVLRGIVYSLRVFDSRERLLFVVNTRSQDHLELHRAGEHRVTSEFAANILPPGAYIVSISAWQVLGGVVQKLEHCLRISVDSVPFDSDHRFESTGSPIASVKAVWRDQAFVPAADSGAWSRNGL